jgi:hypothetical protein
LIERDTLGLLGHLQRDVGADAVHGGVEEVEIGIRALG